MSRIAKHASRIARAARYRLAHWGEAGQRRERVLSCADPRDGLTALGEIVSVVYLTKKGGDARLTEYEHKFRRERPVLAFTRFGRHSLVIAGGSYRMTVGGIDG